MMSRQHEPGRGSVVIGYYVHHHGRGHVQRALAVAAASSLPVVGLSSLPKPPQWIGAWIELARDDDGRVEKPTAHGRLHWVPTGHPGLRSRMAEISAWIDHVEPDLMVVDVSVEVALLARLHGVPVVAVVQPGDRTDQAHELGLGIAEAVIACWPPGVDAVELPASVDRERVHEIGGLSRCGVEDGLAAAEVLRRHAVVLLGSGGSDLTREELTAMQLRSPDWTWTVLGDLGTWVENPAEVLRTADVVVTHAGQNAIAEVAALRRPAVLLPQTRPYGEQLALATALDRGPWPAVAVSVDDPRWGARLDEAAGLDPSGWNGWVDGGAADRFNDICRVVAGTGRRSL